MAKIFQFDNEKVARKNQAEPMDAQLWFKAQQPLLLWMANKSAAGKKLLRLSQTDLTRVDEIAMNFVRQNEYVRDGGTWFNPMYRRVSTTDFRIGAKWANLINSQWDWFCELAVEYYAIMEAKGQRHVGLWQPVVMRPGFAYGTTSTFYPEGNVETVSVDGRAYKEATLQSWATIHDGAGDGAIDTDDDNVMVEIAHDGSGATWYRMYRAFFLFDTAALGDTDTIDSATFTVKTGNAASTSNTLAGQSIVLVSSSPASNTAIVAADYSQLGTTAFSSTIAGTSWAGTGLDNNFALNASGLAVVSKTGVTKLGTRYEADRANAEPASGAAWSSSQVGIEWADNVGNSIDPKLVVVHTAGVISHQKNVLTMGVG